MNEDRRRVERPDDFNPAQSEKESQRLIDIMLDNRLSRIEVVLNADSAKNHPNRTRMLELLKEFRSLL